MMRLFVNDDRTFERFFKEMEALHKQVLERRTLSFVETDQLQPFYEYLRDLKNKAIEEERYLDAREPSELMEHCKAEIDFRNPKATPQGTERGTEKASASAELDEYDEKIKQHDGRTKDKLTSLQKKHEEETASFEKEWSEIMPDKYRRPSKKLMTLRETAHTLAYAGKFEEAQARKNEATVLEQSELREAQRRLNHDYGLAKRKLQAKQRDEVILMQNTAQQQRDLLESKRQTILAACLNRRMVLGAKPPQKRTIRSSSLSQTQTTRDAPVRRSGSKRFGEQRLPPLQPPNAQKKASASNSPAHTQKPPEKPQPQQEEKLEMSIKDVAEEITE